MELAEILQSTPWLLSACVFVLSLLVGSFLFYRYARLAETDVLVTLALTVAIYAIWRGVDENDFFHVPVYSGKER